MPWPHGPRCTCPTPPADAGLLAYTVDCDHHTQLAGTLLRLADQPDEVRLRVLTRGPDPDNLVSIDRPACDGSMTCQCENCVADRRSRMQQVRRRDNDHGGIPIRIKRKAA